MFKLKDENDNALFYQAVAPVLDALKETGVASLTLGHTGKNAVRTRGASAVEDAVDIVLDLGIHRGEKQDKDAVISLKCRKHRLLGFIDPLLLRRVGNDQFAVAEAGEAAEPEALTTSLRCAAGIKNLLASRGQAVRHSDIVKAMVAEGIAEGSAKRVIADLQKKGIIEHDLTGGYVLSDS